MLTNKSILSAVLSLFFAVSVYADPLNQATEKLLFKIDKNWKKTANYTCPITMTRTVGGYSRSFQGIYAQKEDLVLLYLTSPFITKHLYTDTEYYYLEPDNTEQGKMNAIVKLAKNKNYQIRNINNYNEFYDIQIKEKNKKFIVLELFRKEGMPNYMFAKAEVDLNKKTLTPEEIRFYRNGRNPVLRIQQESKKVKLGKFKFYVPKKVYYALYENRELPIDEYTIVYKDHQFNPEFKDSIFEIPKPTKRQRRGE